MLEKEALRKYLGGIRILGHKLQQELDILSYILKEYKDQCDKIPEVCIDELAGECEPSNRCPNFCPHCIKEVERNEQTTEESSGN